MALLPSGIIVAPTGSTKNFTPVEVRGGVIVGITDATDTTAGNPVTETFQFKKNAIKASFSSPKESTSTSSAYNATTSISSTGTFAFNQVQFMIRGSATKINNTASNVLLINGLADNYPHRNVSNKSKGAKTSTAWRAGYWRAVGIAGQRTNWSVAPATNNVNYVKTTNNAQNADDDAIFVTYKAVPGELTYQDGSPNPIQDEYKGRGGAE